MSDDRKEVTVEVNGIEHTMLLDSEDAERYKAYERTRQDARQGTTEAKAATPVNKSRTDAAAK